jgi:16S rRNA (cytosine1402-N4)-methyltransferase
MSFVHESVLPELVDYILTDSEGTYVDATLGAGGHSALLLSRLGPGGTVLGIDRDEEALAHAQERFAKEKRFIAVSGNFAALPTLLQTQSLTAVNGIMLDLGVSSPQLDEAERGFSYRGDAPLDMRMDRRDTLTAAEIVNTWSEAELATVITTYGEERWAKRIAAFICASRHTTPLRTTGELADLIKRAIPAAARREGPHPARRTFQALRLAVNNELEALEQLLSTVLALLKPGGRLGVITFHSLEDRIVKQNFNLWRGRCVCPPGLPVCACGAKPQAHILTKKPLLPLGNEIENNPRARSAKLRVAEKIGGRQVNETG